MGEVYKGFGGQVELLDDGIIIRRKGFSAWVYHGIKGEKFIPFANITSVQFKANGWTTGYIQFGVAGGIESRAGLKDALSDENSVAFHDNARFLKLKEAVESRMGPRALPPTAPTQPASSASLVDDLAKLAALHERGQITDAEFASLKAKLLG